MIIRPSSLSPEAKNEILQRFWRRDPSLWAAEPERQAAVANRLGWLDVHRKMRDAVPDLLAFAADVRERGIRRVVLLGMGGSSLCPLVLAHIFGPAEGHPELVVLDTTDPREIQAVADGADWSSTLFVVASKSGTTVEPNAQYAFFRELVAGAVADPGRHFVAITDPGSPLEELAERDGFLRVFLNPPDIGGRYSALSLFGLVPAALLGMDLGRLLDRAEEMVRRCGPDVAWEENPGCRLGEFLGEYANQSRDKLTLLADAPIRPFGLWLEQLLAESTGKETMGIVPIFGETTGIPGFYGGERIFAYLRLAGVPESESLGDFVRELREAEFPVEEVELRDPYDLGGEFFRWEMATALASHFIGVNAFDEPDVGSAKAKTREVMERYRSEGKMPVKFWVDPQSEIHFRASKLLAPSMKSLSRTLRDIFEVLPSWGYLGFLPYLPYDPRVEELIRDMRHLVRQERGCATTLGFGPRYLHSTGQIYKGGPMSGAFIIFTRRREADYPEIPGLGMSFWHLQFAQAAGDFEALSEARRRVVHVHLPADYALGLESFGKVLSRAVRL
ncbi:phosphoheptose isomerase [Dissulfurirhabdus thermomarina]|uniref:Glucose-6-phosphate isomerase n=1 Tax=Dissulfurirhabdus thermomarina TaxID=1765737 RepID=A0A6N9TMI2_DISTH|nr:phosphoheptose isomerase [Dissulfurirhabdus thermomarina]NDY42501.1 phosphoheptose isomerase [Dissulfurirhabdus thermomarina]NMX24189.1 phosphoheptose isomerase [Dissulfurirhabdus thermomarina]